MKIDNNQPSKRWKRLASVDMETRVTILLHLQKRKFGRILRSIFAQMNAGNMNNTFSLLVFWSRAKILICIWTSQSLFSVIICWLYSALKEDASENKEIKGKDKFAEQNFIH